MFSKCRTKSDVLRTAYTHGFHEVRDKECKFIEDAMNSNEILHPQMSQKEKQSFSYGKDDVRKFVKNDDYFIMFEHAVDKCPIPMIRCYFNGKFLPIQKLKWIGVELS